MILKFPLFLAALFCLAACGRGPDAPEEPARPVMPEEEPATVIATDELGPLDAPPTAIAFWTHPALPFNGLVIVGSPSGLVAYTIEDGAEAARMDGVDVGGVEVVYARGDDAALGYAVLYDEEAERFRFLAIDNAERNFAETPLAPVDTPAADAFCVGVAADGEHKLYALGAGTMQAYSARLSPDGARLEPAASAQTPAGAVDCAVDNRSGAVFVVTSSGDIYRYTEETGFGSQFARAAASEALSIGLALNSQGEPSGNASCCGQIAVLDGADAAVRLFDMRDGERLGAVRISPSFDIDGVETATAMGVGYGNFGAIYRDGVLALATIGDGPVVRLAPYNGAMDAVGASVGETADPRAAVQPDEDEDDGLIIDLAPLNP